LNANGSAEVSDSHIYIYISPLPYSGSIMLCSC
jgi:hypothetical protein